MKAVAVLAVFNLLLVLTQASPLSLRPAVSRPTLTRPAAEQPAPSPCSSDNTVLIRPRPIQDQPQVLLPNNDRPLTPADILQWVEQQEASSFGGSGGSFNIQAEDKPALVLPNDRPLRPSDLLGIQEQPSVRPVPINQQLVGGPDQFIQVRPQVVAEEKPVFVLPNDRPLRPSDLLGAQEQPSVRPVPINQQLVRGPDQFIQVRPQVVAEEKPVFVLPNDRPLRPSDLLQVQEQQQPAVKPVPINQQLGGGPDQFIQVRPQQPIAEEKPALVLPNDRPLRPSDLLQTQEQQPAVKPVPINQQLVGGPDQFIQVRPQQPTQEQPAVRPVPINQQLVGGPDQFIQVRPQQPAQEQQPSVRPVPINQQLVGGPDQFIQIRPQQPIQEQPAVRPVPINQQLIGGPDQFIQIRPQQPAQEQQPSVRPVPINQQLIGGPDQFIQIRPQQPEENKPVFILPNDRPLRPTDLLPQQNNNGRPLPADIIF